MTEVLVIRPTTDADELVFSTIGDLIRSELHSVPELLPVGLNVVDLFGAPVLRGMVEGSLPGRDLTIFIGHGTATALGTPALVDGANVHLIGGVLVAIACESGAGLGPDAVANHVKAFIGFTEEVDLPEPSGSTRRILERLCTDLILGSSAHEAAERLRHSLRMIEAYWSPLRRVAPPKHDPFRSHNAWIHHLAARSNRLCLVVLGDSTTCVA